MSRKLSNIEFWAVVFGCLVVGFSLGTSMGFIISKGVKMPEVPKKISCPNCSQIAIKEGNKITCETCDAVFTITQTGGARVKEVGRLDAIEKRLDRLDNLSPGEPGPEPEPELEPGPGPGPGPEPEPEPDEESILGPE